MLIMSLLMNSVVNVPSAISIKVAVLKIIYTLSLKYHIYMMIQFINVKRLLHFMQKGLMS